MAGKDGNTMTAGTGPQTQDRKELRMLARVDRCRRVKKLAAFAQDGKYLSVRIRAVRSLARLAAGGDPAAKEALMRIAGEGGTPVLRCEGAAGLGNGPEADAAFASALTDAFRTKDVLLCGWERWLSLVTDRELVYRALSGAGKTGVLELLLDHADRKETLLEILDAAGSCSMTPTAVRKLESRRDMTREDWMAAARLPHNPGAALYAVDHLGIESEAFLLELARKKSAPAANRLAALFPGKHTKEIPLSLLSSNELGKAIEADQLTQEQLKKVVRDNLPYYPANAAARKIRDAEFLKKELLRTDRPGYARSVKTARAYDGWELELVGCLRDHPDMLVEYLKNRSGRNREAEAAALECITDVPSLYTVACMQHSLSLEAAKKLPAEMMKDVSEHAEDEFARDYALSVLYAGKLDTAGEEEILPIVSWAANRIAGKEILERALAALKSQKALLAAMKSLRSEFSFSSREEALLPRITDGKALAELYLGDPVYYSGKEVLQRIRETLKGEDAAFVRALEKGLCSGERKWGPVTDFTAAEALACYEGTDPASAGWRHGGEEYVRFLVKELEQAKEYGAADKIARMLSAMYRGGAAGSEALNGIRDRKYTKHMDYVSEVCASIRENRPTELAVRF